MEADQNSESETAVCESCGKVGPRHLFYSTTKRFCGAHCAHSFSAKHRKFINSRLKQTKKNEEVVKKKRKILLTDSLTSSGLKLPLVLPSEMERRDYSCQGFDWGKHLTDNNCEAVPVHLFPHAQMSANWAEIDSGMKVEVLNLDCPVPTKVYWIAQVVKVGGYKALLRYEGFGDDSRCDFWCNLCTHDVHAVGWCATIGKPLVPPKTIQFKYSNWKSFLVQRLTGAKTLPNDFQQRVVQSMDCPFMVNMRLEVMDKTQISRMRIGIVEEVVGGRLRLRYEDSDELNDDFWCHAGSPLIHHIGWSEKVGHRILVAKKEYKNAPGFTNSKPDLFASIKPVKFGGFKVGMKLEAIDPLNLSCICVATVQKVLKSGYLMIGIDGSEAVNGSDWFSYHCSSPSIFPVGFCKVNNIPLNAPKGYKDSFRWEDYLADTKSEAAPVNLFNHEEIQHGFTIGMKLEAVDLMEPRLLCVATVAKVVGRLLRVHFDGWEDEYDQWVDSQSSDIYPVGWCELVGYELQPPVSSKPSLSLDSSVKKKSKPKGQSFLSKKKRKRVSAAGRRSVAESTADNLALSTPPIKQSQLEKSSPPDQTEQQASANQPSSEVPSSTVVNASTTNGASPVPVGEGIVALSGESADMSKTPTAADSSVEEPAVAVSMQLDEIPDIDPQGVDIGTEAMEESVPADDKLLVEPQSIDVADKDDLTQEQNSAIEG